jgi:hypothetical protein
MTINKNTSLPELGAIICQSLTDEGIDCFLSGGAVVSIYTKNEYESYDLDFISFADRKKIKAAMEKLGFSQNRSRMFEHPKTHYTVEFPGTSMTIGDESIRDFQQITLSGNTLRLLTPTDCIKDRLAAHIHWRDRQSLLQDVGVAKAMPFNLEPIHLFCKNEGGMETYSEFLKLLSSN